MMPVRHTVGLVLATILSGSLNAESVSIIAGGKRGQGWMTNRDGVCLVATAAHVVEGVDRGVVFGRGGERGIFTAVMRHPRIADGVDLAVLRVEGAVTSRCRPSNLGFDDSRPSLESARVDRTALSVELVEPSEFDATVGNGRITVVPVQVDTFDAQSTSPTFQVVGARPDIRLNGKGDSGSIIRDPRGNASGLGEPLGMIIEEGDVAVALRFDIIKSFVATLGRAPVAARRSNDAIALTVVEWAGQVPDPNCSPANLGMAGACPMRLIPAASTRTTGVTFALRGRTALQRIVVNFADTPSAYAVDIRATPQSSTWTPLRFCRGVQRVVECNTGPVSAAYVRITFEGGVNVQSVDAF